MVKNKREKGEYGYRNYRRKIQFCQVAFGAAMILAQLFVRNFVTQQATKNILTVMAILSVLPTANAASPLLASIHIRTGDNSFYERVRKYEEKFSVLYDLIVTTKEAILPMDAAVVHETGVYAYVRGGRGDLKKAETSLNEMFAAHRLDPNVHLYQDEAAFLRRLEGLKPSDPKADDGSVPYSLELLKNLSM